MSRIHVLSEHLKNMIAAGEVVERPAGIVKECVENSIDAKATVIEIEVFQGGIERLTITDDGCGMDNEDAHLAFMRHATSKMHSEEELFNIGTMGFRGEAIPSIASVSKVEMMTSNGEQGTLIRYSYGELTVDERCDCPKGTKIDISGLFVKTPARYKHLKSPQYEFSVIADLINKMALSHPDIRFILSNDGRVVFQTSGNGSIQEILYQMYGKEVASNAIEFDGRDEDFHVYGYAIQPKINRANKYFMFIALNTRLIRSRFLQNAIIDAYSDFMPPNRFPIVVLQIDTDTQLVDVNVHPNKWEVRLSKQNQCIALVRKTIEEALNQSLKTVEVAPKVKPIIEQEELEFTYEIKKEEPVRPTFQYQNDFTNYQPIQETVHPPIQEPVQEYKKEEKPIEKQEEVQPEKEIKEDTTIGPSFFHHLQVLAQFHESYILCSNEEGLVIIDQHAAQERYHYEQIQKSLEVPCTNLQPLMVPIQINVPMNVIAMLDKINEKIQFFGLEFEQFGNDQIIVREIPIWFQNVHEFDFFQDLIDFFVQNEDINMAKLRKHVLATMACHSSIRFHRSLTMEEMKRVVYDLQKCKQPYHCPHGRPTVITISDKDLQKEFERG